MTEKKIKTEAEIMAAGKLKAEAAKARSKAKAAPVDLSEMGKPLAPAKLALAWPDAIRGVPNSVLRSALFGITQRGPRAFQQRVKKASVDGVTVIHTGPTLDQADLDVWIQSLHLARVDKIGKRIHFSTASFLKSIGRATGGNDIEWLKDAFARLTSSVVEIQDGKKSYFGPMLHHGARDDETGQYAIEINPAILALFGVDGWSGLDFEQRQALKKQQLAQWLHGFYSTHARPFAYKVETLYRLCGSETKLLKHYRAELRGALEKLAAVTGWSWEIDEADLVHISKGKKLTRKAG